VHGRVCSTRCGPAQGDTLRCLPLVRPSCRCSKKACRLSLTRPPGQSCNKWRQSNPSKCRHGAIPGHGRQPRRSRRARYHPARWLPRLSARQHCSAADASGPTCAAGTPSSAAAHCPWMPGGHGARLRRPIPVGSCRTSLGGDLAWEPRDGYALTNTGWASGATRMPDFCNDCINAVSSIRK
jgi:hypothetical protein